jgi:peroxin-10
VDDGEEKSSGVDPATTVEIDRAVFSHASQPAKRVTQQDSAESIDLLYAHLPDDEGKTDEDAVARINTSAAQANASSTLQCTLCMDTRAPHRATSAVTECGHCFDWACITAWIAEKVSSTRTLAKQHQTLTNAFP